MGTALFGGIKLIPAAPNIPELQERELGDVAAAFPCGSRREQLGLESQGAHPGMLEYGKREKEKKCRAPLQVSLG